MHDTCLAIPGFKQPTATFFHPMMIQLASPGSLKDFVLNKTGFEVGAPSPPWQAMGIYEHAATVDVAHFSTSTLWEPSLSEERPFSVNGVVKGKQYIRDAVDLRGVPSSHYDFFCATDVLEHIANPFKALLEWKRILRPGGLMMLILPFKEVTFDHKREVAKFEHLLDDYRQKITEADLTHLSEVVKLHDLARDPPAGSLENFRARSEKNFQNRAIHQHVYDHRLLYDIFQCFNLEVKLMMRWEYHQLIIGQKH